MKSIYASKLYKASNRKSRIQAALISPSNLSLVKQLAEDLDEEYQTPVMLGLEDEPTDANAVDDESNEDLLADLKVDEEIDPSSDLVTLDDLVKSSEDSQTDSMPSNSDDDISPSQGDEDNATDSTPSEPIDPQPQEASTTVSESLSSISASTCVDIVSNFNTLKNTLNARADLAGVSRILQKDNEVWIYYNDNINLNNIMTDVIEFMMTSEYNSIEFNRLARTDNAIVFIITNC